MATIHTETPSSPPEIQHPRGTTFGPLKRILLLMSLVSLATMGTSGAAWADDDDDDYGPPLDISDTPQASIVSSLGRGDHLAPVISQSEWSDYREVTIDMNAGAQTDGDGFTFSNNVLTINHGGTYRLSGNSSSTVRVDAPSDERVVLVLTHLHLRGDHGPLINVHSAQDVVVATEGSNSLSASLNGENAYAAIQSAVPLQFSGNGSLNISAHNGAAVSSNAHVVFESGSTTLEADRETVNGFTSVSLLGGKLTATSKSHAIVSAGDGSVDNGMIHVGGGNIHIDAAGKALDANSLVMMTGGDVEISSAQEGIEAAVVNIADGSLSIRASDDGVNGRSDTQLVVVDFSGGYTHILADGDAVDVNGHLLVSGGILVAWGASTGAETSLDPDESFIVRGGTVLAAGSVANAIVPSVKKQGWLSAPINVDKGSRITIRMPRQRPVSFTAEKDFEHLLYMTPRLRYKDKIYLDVNGDITRHTAGKSGIKLRAGHGN